MLIFMLKSLSRIGLLAWVKPTLEGDWAWVRETLSKTLYLGKQIAFWQNCCANRAINEGRQKL